MESQHHLPIEIFATHDPLEQEKTRKKIFHDDSGLLNINRYNILGFQKAMR